MGDCQYKFFLHIANRLWQAKCTFVLFACLVQKKFNWLSKIVSFCRKGNIMTTGRTHRQGRLCEGFAVAKENRVVVILLLSIKLIF